MINKNMGKPSLRRVCGWALAAAVLWLQGCAVVTAPGFDYADTQSRSSVTLGQYVPADVNNPPQGVVIPITPALVQAQYQAMPRGVSPEVQSLFAEPQPYTIGPSDIISVVVYDHPELQPLGGVVISQFNDPTGISG